MSTGIGLQGIASHHQRGFGRLNLPHQINFPKPLIEVLKGILSRGKCYIVGGAVRDLMLGKTPNDLDLVSNLNNRELASLPGAKNMKNVTETTIIHVDGIEIEITPLANLNAERIEDDLVERRDLTINAMAIPVFIKNGKIVLGTLLDPSGMGVEDTTRGIIRFGFKGHNHSAYLRACRFGAVLGFTIPTETLSAIACNKHKIANEVPEKVEIELKKLLLSDYAIIGLAALKQTGLLGEILKNGRAPSQVSADRADMARVAQANKEIRLVVLLNELGYTSKTAAGFLKHYHFSNEDIFRTQKLLAALKTAQARFKDLQESDALIREILSGLVGKKQKDRYFADFISLLKAYRPLTLDLESRIIAAGRAPLTIGELEINGNHLKNQGITGRDLGETLKRLLSLVIKDPSRNVREILLNNIKEDKK